MKSHIRTWTIAALTILSLSAGMAAQDNLSPNNKPKHQKYKLIDLGTFGGPASELTTNNGNGAGSLILSNQGTLTGSADTSVPDPYAPNCYVATCFISHAFRWDNGVLTDIGTVPGANTSQGTAINDRGWIAGLLQPGIYDPILNTSAGHAALWRGKEVIDLGTLGGYEGVATSLNNAGGVFGFSTVDGPIDPYSFLGQSVHTFYWRNGAMQDVGTLGGPDAFAGIAHQLTGEVFGASFTDSTPNPTTGIPTLHPFTWRNGQIRDLGSLGGTLCCQGSIVSNSRGEIASDSTLAGDLVSHPFLWDGHRLIDLGTLGGANALAYNISESGEVVGASDTPTSRHGYLWSHGVMTDLGSLGRTSSAIAINSRGQITGSSRIDDTIGNNRAFLWENGGPLVDLNTLIPPHSSLTLVWASNINDRGMIAGLGVPTGCLPQDYLLCGHAYLLIPDGDCDRNCQNRVDQSQAEAELRRVTAPKQVNRLESPVRSPEQFRNLMRQRFGLPGAHPTLRD